MSKQDAIYAVPVPNQKGQEPIQAYISSAEDTPAYAVLQEYNLLDTRYRKDSFEDIFTEMDLTPNSSQSHTLAKRFKWGVYCTPFCGLIFYVSLFDAMINIMLNDDKRIFV